MFGERHTIDESSCDMIDEMDYDTVDDIKDAKRYGSHAYHLCDEGQEHEWTDRQMSSAYNTTPRTSPVYQQTDSQNTSPYPKPVMRQYTPQAAPRQTRNVQTTVVNGRTFERPAEAPQSSTAQAKAAKAFITFIVIGIVGACLFSPILIIVCLIMGFMILGSVSKCTDDDMEPLNKMIKKTVAILVIIIILLFGKNLLDFFKALFDEAGDLGGY